jgi:hypothetical protein
MPGLGLKDPAHRANINRSGHPTGAKGLLAKAIADRDKDMPAILDKAVEMAKAGDVQMIAFLLGRQWPAPKPTDHMVQFSLPANLKAGDLDGITLAILQAVSEGKLAPTDAAKLSSALVSHVHLVPLPTSRSWPSAWTPGNRLSRARRPSTPSRSSHIWRSTILWAVVVVVMGRPATATTSHRPITTSQSQQHDGVEREHNDAELSREDQA